MVVVGSYQGLCNMYRVFASFDPRTLSAKEAGHKQLGGTAAFLHWLTIVCQLGISTAWLWGSTTEPYLCRAANASVGLAYALTASMLIMAHMCKEPFAPPMWAVAGMAFAAANSRMRWVDPLTATVAFAAVTLAAYLHYVISVIREICAALDIYCLTLKRRPGDEDE